MDKKKIIYVVSGLLLVSVIGGGAFLAGKQTGVAPTPTPIQGPTTLQTPTPTTDTTPSPSPTAAKTPTPSKASTQTPTKSPQATASPTPTPGVVNIEASVSPASSNICTQKFSFSAKIYTNAAMTVKYKWIRSDNASAPEQTLTYTGAGVQTVTDDWTIGPKSSGETVSGWERIEITSPGSALGNKAEFTLTCP